MFYLKWNMFYIHQLCAAIVDGLNLRAPAPSGLAPWLRNEFTTKHRHEDMYAEWTHINMTKYVISHISVLALDF